MIFTLVHVSAEPRFHHAAHATLNEQSVNRPAVSALHRIVSKDPVGNSNLEGHACGYRRDA